MHRANRKGNDWLLPQVSRSENLTMFSFGAERGGGSGPNVTGAFKPQLDTKHLFSCAVQFWKRRGSVTTQERAKKDRIRCKLVRDRGSEWGGAGRYFVFG